MKRSIYQMILIILTLVISVVVGVGTTGTANAAWRTPPIKTVGGEIVSCDLLNSSGADITVSNLVIRVQSLEGSASSTVVSVPGPLVIADGRGIRGSSPISVLQYTTVYCEIDENSVISTVDQNLFFTMTVEDTSGKAVTAAIPRANVRRK